MKKLMALLVALVLTFSLAAVTSAEGETWYLGILVHSLDNEFWAQEANGGILFADSKDNVEYQVLITDGDDNKEIQAIKDFIAQYGDHAFFVADPLPRPTPRTSLRFARKPAAMSPFSGTMRTAWSRRILRASWRTCRPMTSWPAITPPRRSLT